VYTSASSQARRRRISKLDRHQTGPAASELGRRGARQIDHATGLGRPRSLIRTTTLPHFFILVTLTLVPNGKASDCAPVSAL